MNEKDKLEIPEQNTGEASAEKAERSKPAGAKQQKKGNNKKVKEKKKPDKKEGSAKAPKNSGAPLFLRAADPETVILVSVLVGVLAIIAYFLLTAVTSLNNIHVGIIVAGTYGLVAALILLRSRLTVRQYVEMRDRLTHDQSIMTELLSESHIPAILTHDDGTVVWYNKAMRTVLGVGDVHITGKKLSKFCPIDINALLEATRHGKDPDRIAITMGIGAPRDGANAFGIAEGLERRANGVGGIEYLIGSKRYIARAYTAAFPSKKPKDGMRNYNLTIFEENTELFDLKDKMDNENLVVAYIILDNLDELAQYAKIDYRMAANNIELHLKNWAIEVGGVLCEYDRDKYMLLIHQEKLLECINDNFPILKTIRAEELGNSSMSITISMGISGVGSTISEREKNAQLALDTALRRGGDQIVIKKEKEFEYFGGRSKSAQIREKINSRVYAETLIEKIAGFSKVMIMGHKNPDCDSIGACIGMSRFVRSVASPETEVRIIVNTASDTFIHCTEDLFDHPDYRNMFIDGLDALDTVDSKTLLIIVDANNFNIVECSDVVRSVENIVIIDHHRKSAEYTRPISLEYIDPSASSASELITEMIESELAEGSLLNEEANVLLAGIMLDTMNFTRSSGVRTYSAAYYLRANGARAEEARLFFEDDLAQPIAEATFLTPGNITTFRGCIAIAISMGSETPQFDRIAAAKTSERLISTRGIEAAFALVKIGDSIVISARSTGQINVQLILERLHGGGHFDSAGAQVNGKSMNEVLVLLKNAINHYFDD